MSLKERISSPLEAGPSILDAHNLPPHLTPALEYIADRLAKRNIRATLIVARRDYQLPSAIHACNLSSSASYSHSSSSSSSYASSSSASSSSASSVSSSPALASFPFATPVTPNTPLGSRFHLGAGRVTALKQLVRSASSSKLRAAPSRQNLRAESRSSSRSRWPMTPATPLSPPPKTPSTASSTTTDTMSSAHSSCSCGMRLIRAGSMDPRAEKVLSETLVKAEKRYGTGTEWLSPALDPALCGLTDQLVHSSIIQNEVHFTSDNLTLISLDRLYCLKSALSSYSKTHAPMRLEDAVDELRRLILSRGGAKIAKADLLRAYEWLGVSDAALYGLDRMYRRAYGGPEQVGAISDIARVPAMPSFGQRAAAAAALDPVIRDDSEEDDGFIDEEDEDNSNTVLEEGMVGLALTTPLIKPKPASPKAPQLKLQTTFDQPQVKRILPSDIAKQTSDATKGEHEDDDENDLTARPDDFLPIMFPLPPLNSVAVKQPQFLHPHASLSLDGVLMSAGAMSPGGASCCLSPGGGPRSSKMGPMTPNGYDDISPTTRGEWGFLMVDRAMQGKTAAVETC